MTKQATCEQLIDKQLENRLESLLPNLDDMSIGELRELCDYHGIEYDLSDGDEGDYSDEEDASQELIDDIRDNLHDRINEDVLSVEKFTSYKVLLSWGGPADWFELVWKQDEDCGYWDHGFYVYQDWFDGARRQIGVEQTEALANVFGIYPEEM